MKAIDIPDGMKRCSKCGEVKAVGEFGLDRSRKDGLHSNCKKCVAEGYSAYRHKNIEKIREVQRRYRINNQEKLREIKRSYTSSPEYKTLEKIRYIRDKTGAKIYRKDIDDATFLAIHSACMLEREIKNVERESMTDEMRKEKTREYTRGWNINNPEKRREISRKYYAKNAEKVREYRRQYYAKNSEKEREYYHKNKEKKIEQNRQYRARKKAEKALLALDNSATQADNVDM